MKKLSWDNIEELCEYEITYLLYLEKKSLETIAKIRNISKSEVEKQVIKGKLEYKIKSDKNKKQEVDPAKYIISLDKLNRTKAIKKLNLEQREKLVNAICKRYITFKNIEDRMILLWVMGELKDERFLPFLRMELSSKLVNFRRLSCSALGKIAALESREWLQGVLKDENSQVIQYAIKSLSKIGNKETIELLKNIIKDSSQKEYVVRAAIETIEMIEERLKERDGEKDEGYI